MKKAGAFELVRTVASTVNLAYLVVPVVAGVLAPILFEDRLVAVVIGLLGGFVLALSGSRAHPRVVAWWASFRRGYKIERVDAVLDLSDTGTPRTYVEKTWTKLTATRKSPGIVAEYRAWSGHGQLGEPKVTDGRIDGEANRGRCNIHIIDLKRELAPRDSHTYGFELSYLDTQGDFQPFFEHGFECSVGKLRMMVRFAPGEMPASNAIRVRGRGARLEYDHAASTVTVEVNRPRVHETYGIGWQPVASPGASASEGEPSVVAAERPPGGPAEPRSDAVRVPAHAEATRAFAPPSGLTSAARSRV